MAPEFSCTWFESRHDAAVRCGPSAVAQLPGWKGFQHALIDGTQPDGSEHRLKVLRTIQRGSGLPCRLVAQFDLATGLCVDAVAAQDAYASEQILGPDTLRACRAE